MQIILRLIPKPMVQVDLLAPYADFQQAANTVSALLAHQRITPTCIEFMERDSLLASERLQKEVPFRDAAAHLLIQLDGSSQAAVDADLETVGELCLEHGALDVLVARDTATRDRLWEARRKIIDALKHESPINLMKDVVVPSARIPKLLEGIKKVSAQLGVRIICLGHAGDGNVYVNTLKDDLSVERCEALVPELAVVIYSLSLSLSGTITGEHGIGATRGRYLPLALDDTQIQVMRQVEPLQNLMEVDAARFRSLRPPVPFAVWYR